MAVLCKDDGAVEALIQSFQLPCRGIVRSEDRSRRREALGILPLEEATEERAHLRETVGARSIELAHVFAHLDTRLRQRILVAHAPHDYRGMILVTGDGGQRAGLQDILIGTVGQMLVAIAEGDLVDEVEAQRVGQLIEAGLTGIMRQAEEVDRCLLHHLHVLQRQLVADHLHRPRISTMNIHATQLDGASVQLQHITVDADLADANLLRDRLQRLPLLSDVDLQRI